MIYLCVGLSIFLLTFQGGVFLLTFFVIYLSCLSFHCSLVATCCERAGLLYVMFSCVIVTFACGVLGQVWYLIVWIPEFCFLLTYIYHELAATKNCLFSECCLQRVYIQISITAISSTTTMVSELTIIRV